MKKKYLLLIILITSVVVGPFAFKKWSEARRLKRIRQTKQQATQIDAIPLTDFLNELEDTSPEKTLLILYTGNTQAHLEPCGCFIGQSGGMPRRATAVLSMKEKGFSPILLDLGGIIPSKTKQHLSLGSIPSDTSTEMVPDEKLSLDKLRVQTYLSLMSSMGYQALVPSKTDAHFGMNFAKIVLENQFFPLLAANLELSSLNIHPYVVKTVAGKKIALIGISSLENLSIPNFQIEPALETLTRILPEIQNQAEYIVLLSNLPPKINREIASKHQDISAILSHETGEVENVGDVLLAYSNSKGKTLGALILSQAGGIQKISVREIALTEEVTDEPKVRALLNDFYKEVARNPLMQKTSPSLFLNEILESDSENAYVGSEACKVCHEKEFEQWSHTSHAVAFNTLLSVGRQFYPECISCHVTGFGYESGYEFAKQEKEHLAEVGCETCHAPGKQHVLNPFPENIRGKVEAKICVECHSPEHSPGFEQILADLMPEVNHNHVETTLTQIVEQRTRGPVKPQIELFVMSYCSFGVEAEKKLIPFIKKYGERIDFQLRFIAEKKVEEGKSEDDLETLKFESLHGEPEVLEDMRQTVIAQLYPDKYLDYVLCRADHLKKAWSECAIKTGIDVARVSAMMESTDAKALFVENIKRSAELSITASPTVVIDGRRIKRDVWLDSVTGECR